MRKATYKIKKAAGDPEDAELSVSQAGGSVDQNVQRWIGQFEQKQGEEPKRSERKVGDLKVTTVEVHGTFKSGMPGMGPAEPKTGWALLGATALRVAAAHLPGHYLAVLGGAAALWLLAGSPIPTGLPSVSELGDALTQFHQLVFIPLPLPIQEGCKPLELKK